MKLNLKQEHVTSHFHSQVFVQLYFSPQGHTKKGPPNTRTIRESPQRVSERGLQNNGVYAPGRPVTGRRTSLRLTT